MCRCPLRILEPAIPAHTTHGGIRALWLGQRGALGEVLNTGALSHARSQQADAGGIDQSRPLPGRPLQNTAVVFTSQQIDGRQGVDP
ncbi:hypothetical protein D9M68_951080 [compost metagenome]